jgi:hypothetical protein
MSRSIKRGFENNYAGNLKQYDCKRDTNILVNTYLKPHLNATKLPRASSRVRWLNAD